MISSDLLKMPVIAGYDISVSITACSAAWRESGWQREILPYLDYEETSRKILALAKPREFGIGLFHPAKAR